MKILLISNQHPNDAGVGNPIMYRMRDAMLQDSRVDEVDFLPFYNRVSIFGEIRKAAGAYDVIHVHFGGIYALLVWFSIIGVKAKKFITFHGTDIHAKQLKSAKGWKNKMRIHLNQKASFISIRLFDRCGFVASEMLEYVPGRFDGQIRRKSFIQPLGVDYSTFVPMNRADACRGLGLDEGHYVLFSDVSNTAIKRRDIAQSIVDNLGSPYKMLRMSGVKPEEVPYYINACDFAILTSDEEGSPNIIREVLSLNKPFFSVDVGDSAKQLYGLCNSAIIPRDPTLAAAIIRQTIAIPYVDNTRDNKRSVLDFVTLNKDVISLYHSALS